VPAVGTPLLCGLPRRVPTSRAACACRSSMEPLAWGSCGEPPPQAVGRGLVDSEPVDEALRALMVELGFNRADELPELWLSHHELDSTSDLPAG
ncbi:CITE1 protein, partial [Polioptila caerulea]|nr:CITE1 protein [Polioptila caerulea]